MILKNYRKDSMTRDEFIDTLVEKIPTLQGAIKLNMNNNYKKGKNSIDEAFANLRFEVMLDVLSFLKEHDNKNITVEEVDNFIIEKILKV